MQKKQNEEDFSPDDLGSGSKSSSTELSDIAYLIAIKNMQAITQDAESFIRHNHMIYTATLTAAMKKLVDGEKSEDILAVFEKLEGILNHNKEYYSDMNLSCIKMLTDIRDMKTS